jgi:hypothetical protein
MPRLVACHCGTASTTGARGMRTSWGQRSGKCGRRLWLFLALAVAVSAGAAATSALAAQPSRTETRPLEQLWSRYPLAPGTQQPKPAKPSAPAATTRPSVNDGGGGGGVSPALLGVLVVLGIAAAVAVTGAASGSLEVKPEGALMNVFRRGRDAAGINRDDDVAPPPGDVTARIRAATSDAAEAPLVAALVDGPAQEQRDAKQQHAADPDSMSKIGERVATVLETAQEAARTIRQDAQDEADALLKRVTREAEETRARADQEAEELRRDAERVLHEAEERSGKTRAEADKFAERRREEADEQAAATLSAAKANAASIAEAAAARHDELLTNVSVTEDRLRALSSALRNVASELDDLLAAETADEEKEPDTEESLDDSLRTRAGASRGRSRAK